MDFFDHWLTSLPPWGQHLVLITGIVLALTLLALLIWLVFRLLIGPRKPNPNASPPVIVTFHPHWSGNPNELGKKVGRIGPSRKFFVALLATEAMLFTIFWFGITSKERIPVLIFFLAMFAFVDLLYFSRQSSGILFYEYGIVYRQGNAVRRIAYGEMSSIRPVINRQAPNALSPFSKW
ncbi:MAG: hypothetical protein ACK5LX_04550 [Oscillospiraceae bacterium]